VSSLRTRLLAALIGALLVAGGLASALTYFSARAEINALLDEELRQVALSVRDYALLDLPLLAPVPIVEPEHRVIVQVWDPAGRALYLSNTRMPLPLAAQPGFVTVAHGGREWRMFTALAGLRVVQTAQPTAVRTQLAAESALRILVPILAVLPLLAALVWFIVGRGLAPVAKLARTLAARSPTSLDPLSTGPLPDEVAPLVTSLNGLLGRLGQAFDVQRRFAADAAHELRTPLTALGLQIQLVERAKTDEARTTAIERLKEGVKRATRLVQQLLTLARIEPDAAHHPFARVALDRVARTVATDLGPLASAKPVSLSLEVSGGGDVNGSEEALGILASNLVDNAIRYTPAGGHVEVRVRREGGDALLEVADDGLGIPHEERARVFDRFYRGSGAEAPGSGLGLAIAREIADMHQGRLELAEGLGGRGVTARLRLAAV